jgi:hypothetical protein
MKIIGQLQVGRNAIIGTKNMVRSINGTNFSSTGSITINSYTTDEFYSIISTLPLSRFGDYTSTPLPVTSTGFVVNFTDKIPVLLSGNAFIMQAQTINLTTIKANPANSLFYVYVNMVQGIAQYLITETVIAESGTSAYNTFWIGRIATNATQISSISLIKRSRLDVYSPSINAAGSSFPVSTGNPSSTGTITW